MSGLREKVAEAIDKAAIVEMTTMGFEFCWLENPETCADAAIAAMRDALLSDEAVEEMYQSLPWGTAVRSDIRTALGNALAALGVQEGER